MEKKKLVLLVLWMLLIPTFLFFSGSCNKTAEPEEGKMRVAVATFSHETCTFCPDPTTIEDWEYWGPPTRDILNVNRGYIGGFKNIIEEYGGVELVGITSPRGARGGSSGSWITQEAFADIRRLLAGSL